MNFDKNLLLKPYSSVRRDIQTSDEGREILETILLSEINLEPIFVDKDIILYGAGSLGKMAKDFFNYLNIPFLYVIDRNSEIIRADLDWEGIEVKHPNEVKKEDKKNCLLIICIVTVELIRLRDDLKAEGWENIAFFYDISETYSNEYPLSNGWFLKKPSKQQLAKILKVFMILDEISRKHYLQFIAWRRLRLELLIDGIKIDQNSRFFIPEIIERLHEHEVFVDCGAHFGSVTKKFLEITNRKYKKIYAIEPDRDSFQVLKQFLKDIPNSVSISCALSNKNGKDRFYQGFDYASKLNEVGNEVVDVSSLDSMKIPATFIKIHLEGGEFLSLKGAINTIQNLRPILVVTIYHNPDGVWKIPRFLMKFAKNYKFLMRLHSWGGTGAVFYAIPEERE